MTPMLGIMASAGRPHTVVTGGTLSSDATYYYRAFTANGTFGVSGGSLLADVLVIAGGGGSGGINTSGTASGGGGSGGIFYATAQSFNSNQSVTIGAGGAASAAGASTGNKGINSTFGSLTARPQTGLKPRC